MSVPSWERKLSKTNFLYKSYTLAVRIGQLVVKKPKKYRVNYGDSLIQNSLKAFNYLQRAQDIYLTKDLPMSEKMQRREYLIKARGITRNICTDAYIFYGLVKECDGMNYETLCKEVNEIGELVDDIVNLINGTLKSDKKYYK